MPERTAWLCVFKSIFCQKVFSSAYIRAISVFYDILRTEKASLTDIKKIRNGISLYILKHLRSFKGIHMIFI